MTEPVHIISLGGGVQSSTLDFMADCGEISPRPFCAIMADTQAEPKKVYVWVEFLRKECSIPIRVVTKGNLRAAGLVIYLSKKSGKRYLKSLIPAFTLQPNGKKGLLGRKCTKDYKVAMIIREINKILGADKIKTWKKFMQAAYKAWLKYQNALKEYKKARKAGLEAESPDFPINEWQAMQANALAVSWIGISADEAQRMKDSQVPWIRNRWPLIEKNMTRQDCKDWMSARGLPEPPRSACTFCPFHSDEEWRRIKEETPDEFADVVRYEKELQIAASQQEALTGVPFLHGDCKPLETIEFAAKPGYLQVDLFGQECSGMCGV